MRLAILVYGVICYLVTLATCIYLVGFVGNLIVPITIDGQPASHFLWAVAIDTSLVVLFGVQHSLMARPIIKRRLSRFIPESAERSTYVLMTSLFLILLFWCWQPIGIDLWRFENQYLRAAVYVLFFAGWGLVFLSTTLIDHV